MFTIMAYFQTQEYLWGGGNQDVKLEIKRLAIITIINRELDLRYNYVKLKY